MVSSRKVYVPCVTQAVGQRQHAIAFFLREERTNTYFMKIVYPLRPTRCWQFATHLIETSVLDSTSRCGFPL